MSDTFFKILGCVCIDFFVKVTPATALFCAHFQKRPHFGFRLVCSFLFALLYSLGIALLWMNFLGLSSFVWYILLLAGVYLIELFLFNASFSSLLFNLLGGYALNQIFLFLFILLSYLIPPLKALSIFSFSYYFVQALWFALVYPLSYHIFIKRQAVEDRSSADQPELYCSLAISLFLIQFHLVQYQEVAQASLMDYMCYFCLILFYIVILILRSGLLKNIRSEQERQLTQKVWEEKEKSLRLTSEAVNMINIKYHDLKHIIPKLHSAEEIQASVAMISQSMNDYAQAFSTGSDTLDMILTEQMLKCKQNDVELTCIADGAALSFLSTLDMISLFSNALDNAYEAVLPLPRTQRQIYLTVKQAAGSVSICVENPYAAPITLQNGLPKTTKSDQRYHGFGMQSIRSTVAQYHGDLTISTEDQWFRLCILFPQG
jgi:hypothetical protein